MSKDYLPRTVAPNVYIYGPHRERFWMGNFRPLRKRFATLADAIADKSSPEYANARRFVDLIDLDRKGFAALPDAEASYWLVNMPVVALSPPADGLLVYSPIPLDWEGRLQASLDALGPVRVVVAPHAAHSAGLASFRKAYPDALFICPKGARLGEGKSLSDMRPELDFHMAVEDETSIKENAELANWMADDFAVEVVNDAVLNEIVLYHKESKTLINADFVYKAAGFETVAGVGGPQRQYLEPEWFAVGYQLLNLDPSPSALLPDNRAFLARHQLFDREGFFASLERILGWDLDWMICTHTDPIAGATARDSILKSWEWLRQE